jgi:hypothetical protein
MRCRVSSLVALSLSMIFVSACEDRGLERRPLTGTSPLVEQMHAAAAEHGVPAELLAGIAWSETAYLDHSRHWSSVQDDHSDHAHGPRSAGVMGLPELGAVRSVKRAAELLGVEVGTVVFDGAANIRGAAAILRALADETYGANVLVADGSRDRWLYIAERYFDAGATGTKLARETRRTIARGLSAKDEAGLTVRIPSFAELYGEPAIDQQRFEAPGEYPMSTWVAANGNNYSDRSRGAADIDVVVIHTTQGAYAGTISWFQNAASQVSAHYVIRASDGDITQMVAHEDIAWHAGNWSYNERSIGIEHEGWVADPNTYTMAQYQASADLTRWLCDNLGIPKDRQHIIGHVEVPGATHSDPGQFWDWTLYMNLVGQMGPNPMPGNGTLKGVVYEGSDTTARITGATVTINPGNHQLTSSSTGFWELGLAPGDYTIIASKAGYANGTQMRTVVAGGETWGSVSIVPSSNATGTYRGVVYDAARPDFSRRLPNAKVTLSNSTVVMTNAEGEFLFEVPPGNYTATAELGGWETNYTMRTVVAGMIAWGSIGLVEVGSTMNQPPRVPLAESPINRVTAVNMQPIFTVSGVQDPENDPMTLEVEIYGDETMTVRHSSVRVAVPLGAAIVSWKHPAADLPPLVPLYWRARALDGNAASPWSVTQSFEIFDDGMSVWEPTMEVHTGEVLPGVGTNAAPTSPEIRDPLENAIVGTTRPQVLVAAAQDPEGDRLSYQVEIALDDLFEVVEVRSELVASEGELTSWVTSTALALGSRYYVRARAADERLFGAWSRVIAFSVDPNAANEDGPGNSGDRGGSPMIDAKVIDDGGCTAAGTPGAGSLVLLLGVVIAYIRRR